MLIEAQEQERARIARELHDDINQRLALLTIAIEQARQNLIGTSPCKVDQCLRELKHEVIGIATDIHTIAHDLHSSSLEYLGLVPAVTKFADEIGKRHGIQIEIENEGMLGALPPEISLCLFRVVQEGLHNAARHSGTKRVEVLLQQTKTQIHVALTDSGKGFDVAGTASGQGMGLASMRERIRLVHGKIVIQSKPALGTSIHAWVPLQANGIPNIGSSETTVMGDNAQSHSFSDYKRKCG
jgi:signal transduction histidine kinase